MPAGIQVFGESGVAQIDQDYRNYHYAGLVQINCNNAYFSGFLGNTTIAGDRTTAFAIVNSPKCNIIPVVLNDGTVRLYGTTLTYAGVINVMVFRLAVSSGGGNVGLQVFNAVGETVFDSNSKPMRVIDFIRGNTDGSTTRNYGVGQIAILVGQNAQFFEDLPHPNLINYYLYMEEMSFLQTSGASSTISGRETVRLDSYYVPAGSLPLYGGGIYWNEWFVYLTLDVTGYL